MDEMEMTGLRRTLSSFDGVWQRVGGTEIPGADNPRKKPLRRLVDDEISLAHALRCIARMGASDRAIFALASESMRRADRLRGEWFLETGERYCPSPHKMEDQPRLDAMRDARNAALALAESYHSAAKGAEDDKRCLFEEYARQNDRAACLLRQRILACFA